MKNMAFGCDVSFCFFLLFFSLSFAANQTSNNDIECFRSRTFNGMKLLQESIVNCSTTCVVYTCIQYGSGCSSHFYEDCSSYDYAIQFIKSKTPEKFVYQDMIVSYYSGCYSKNGTENMGCLHGKVDVMLNEVSKRQPTMGNPIWYYEKPGDEKAQTVPKNVTKARSGSVTMEGLRMVTVAEPGKGAEAAGPGNQTESEPGSTTGVHRVMSTEATTKSADSSSVNSQNAFKVAVMMMAFLGFIFAQYC